MQSNSASNLTAAPASRQNTTASNTTTASTAPVKVKAWFDRDTCVVIRMPPRGQFNYSDLYQKIVDRRRLEFRGNGVDETDDLDIEYRDEKDGEYYLSLIHI